MRPYAAISAFVLGSTLFLTGCATASADTPTTTAPTPSVATAPSPAPSASLAAVPFPDDPAEWSFTADGLGPLVLGMPLAEAVAELDGYAPDEDCPNPSVRLMDPIGGTGAGFVLGQDADDRLVLVVASDPGPGTGEGIEVGSTLGDARAAYPSLATVAGPYGYYSTVELEPGWISFRTETEDDASPIFQVMVADGFVHLGEFCG